MKIINFDFVYNIHCSNLSKIYSNQNDDEED